MSNKGKGINSKVLEKKAVNVIGVILYATELFFKHTAGKTKGVEEIKELKKIGAKKEYYIAFLVSISFLFQAQKTFWENVIKNEKEALRFEQTLYDLFEKSAGADPRPFINDIVKYVKKQGKRGEVMYLGSKICKELGKPDVILMFKINAVFTSILRHGFFESLKRAWKIK